jgi:hypothetical protein
VSAPRGAALMKRDSLAFMEHFDGVGGNARLDLLTQRSVRYGIVMTVDVEVIVERQTADDRGTTGPPFRARS